MNKKEGIIKYRGELDLTGKKINCYVLEDGRRILSERGSQTALKIVEKYENYFRQPIIIKKGSEETPVPFIQILDALTGSGKTVILAKTIGEISKLSERNSVIL